MKTRRSFLVIGFVLLMALFLSLGAWQLRRADEKALMFERFATGGGLPELVAPIDDREVEEHRYRRVELRGRYVSSRQLLLDSMTHQGRAGYQVLTPLRTRDGGLVLVNRGWVAGDADRRILPRLEVGEAARVVRGRLDALPRPGLKLEAPGGSAGWPQVVFFPTFEELEARLEEPIARYQLLLDSQAPEGFVREWRPRTLTPERHVGYAIQWFSFAGVLLVMGVVLGLRSKPDPEDD